MDNIRKIHTKIFSSDTTEGLEKSIENFFSKYDLEFNSISYSHAPKKIRKGATYDTYSIIETYQYSALLTYYKN